MRNFVAHWTIAFGSYKMRQVTLLFDEDVVLRPGRISTSFEGDCILPSTGKGNLTVACAHAAIDGVISKQEAGCVCREAREPVP